jgi:Cu(I)/Ag(I) efflux system membrane protein CusA/SilA
VYAERVRRAISPTQDIDSRRIARYGLRIEDVQDVIESALGGENITQTLRGVSGIP